MRDTAADDAAILAVLRSAPARSSAIAARVGLDFRVVDRALQRLRRRGAIVFHQPNCTWWIVEEVTP